MPSGLIHFLAKRWFLLLLGVGAASGFFLRDLAPHIPRNATVAVFMTTMFCIGLTATLGALLRALANWRAGVISLGCTYLIAPAVAFVTGRLFFDEGSDMYRGWILLGCAATTISSAVVYARMAGGNGALGLVLSNISNLSSILITPAMIGLLLSAQVDVPVGPMIQVLLVGVLVPVAAAQLVANTFKGFAQRFAKASSTISQLGIVTVVFMSMCRTFHGAPDSMLIELPQVGSKLVVLSVGLYFALSLGSFFLSRKLGLVPADAVAVAYISGQKTLAATVVLADRFFSPAAVMPVIIYHLTQMLLGGFDARFFRRQTRTPKPEGSGDTGGPASDNTD